MLLVFTRYYYCVLCVQCLKKKKRMVSTGRYGYLPTHPAPGTGVVRVYVSSVRRRRLERRVMICLYKHTRATRLRRQWNITHTNVHKRTQTFTNTYTHTRRYVISSRFPISHRSLDDNDKRHTSRIILTTVVRPRRIENLQMNRQINTQYHYYYYILYIL